MLYKINTVEATNANRAYSFKFLVAPLKRVKREQVKLILRLYFLVHPEYYHVNRLKSIKTINETFYILPDMMCVLSLQIISVCTGTLQVLSKHMRSVPLRLDGATLCGGG